jgi:hypothetical protein
MYARTNRCYNERGSRTNYVRSSVPHCTFLGCGEVNGVTQDSDQCQGSVKLNINLWQIQTSKFFLNTLYGGTVGCCDCHDTNI